MSLLTLPPLACGETMQEKKEFFQIELIGKEKKNIWFFEQKGSLPPKFEPPLEKDKARLVERNMASHIVYEVTDSTTITYGKNIIVFKKGGSARDSLSIDGIDHDNPADVLINENGIVSKYFFQITFKGKEERNIWLYEQKDSLPPKFDPPLEKDKIGRFGSGVTSRIVYTVTTNTTIAYGKNSIVFKKGKLFYDAIIVDGKKYSSDILNLLIDENGVVRPHSLVRTF
jgi:hypothetical protein